MKRSVLLLIIVLGTSSLLPARAAQEEDLSGDQRLPDGDVPIISASAQEVEYSVATAMKLVANATKWQVICTQKAGTVRFGIWMRDMMAGDLIKAVCKSQGLAYRVDGNAVYVMTREEYNQNYGGRKLVITLKHAPPDRVVAALQPLLSGNDAKIGALSETGAVVIYDTPASLEILKRIAQEIDQPLVDKVVPFSNTAVAEAVRTLQPFVTQIGRISANEPSNQIIISDIAGRAEMLERMAKQLDRPAYRQTRQFYLRYADASTVAQYLADMFGLRAAATTEPVVRGVEQAQGSLPPGQAQPSGQTGAQSQKVRNITDLAEPPAAAGQSPSAIQRAPGAAAVAVQPALVAGSSAANQGTVIADPRSNSIWVTETPERLVQIGEVILGLDIPLVTKSYRLNYANLEDINIEERLARMLPSAFDHYEVDPVTRRITITTTPDKLDNAMELIREWDAQPAQVFITGKVLSVNHDFLRDLGVTYDILVDNMDEHIGTDIRATGIFPPAIAAVPRAGIRVGDLANDDFTVLLEALETDSRTRLLSSPRVLVVDGSQAQFVVATDEPYTEVVIIPDTQAQVENVKFKPVGVTFGVTPRISDDSNIFMNVGLEVSSLQEIRNGVPVVATRNMVSDVIVGDNQALVIGGLISDEAVKTVDRVPFLGEIPLLGILFRRTHVDRSQRELILVVVPSIVGSKAKGPEPTLDGIEKNLKSADYLKGEVRPEAVSERQSNADAGPEAPVGKDAVQGEGASESQEE